MFRPYFLTKYIYNKITPTSTHFGFSQFASSQPSQPSRTSIESPVAAAENASTNTVQSKCEPTSLLREYMQKDRLIEEKIFEYLAAFVPVEFKDKHWLFLLHSQSTMERVRYFWFMGFTQNREELERQKYIRTREMLEKKNAEELAKLEAGGMGYGPIDGLYRQIYSVHTRGAKSALPYTNWNYAQMTLQEQLPRLLYDCQFMPRQSQHEFNLVRLSANHAYFVNYEQRIPFITSFINADLKNLVINRFFKGQILMPNRVGEHMRFPPEICANNPYHDPCEPDPSKQVIYLSRYAHEMLDGPLIHKAYVLPFTMDLGKETVGAVRNGHYRTMCLPVNKYIKWNSGKRALSFVVIANILREVAINGGDWAYALEKHIPMRHRKTIEERKKILGPHNFQNIQETRKQKYQISHSIIELLGHQPDIFMERPSQSAGEYAKRLANI